MKLSATRTVAATLAAASLMLSACRGEGPAPAPTPTAAAPAPVQTSAAPTVAPPPTGIREGSAGFIGEVRTITAPDVTVSIRLDGMRARPLPLVTALRQWENNVAHAAEVDADAPPRPVFTGSGIQDNTESTQAPATPAATVDPDAPAPESIDVTDADLLVEARLTLRSVGGLVRIIDVDDAAALRTDALEPLLPVTSPTPESCPPFAHGRIQILPGDTRRGCVAFIVPAGADIQGLEFALPGAVLEGVKIFDLSTWTPADNGWPVPEPVVSEADVPVQINQIQQIASTTGRAIVDVAVTAINPRANDADQAPPRGEYVAGTTPARDPRSYLMTLDATLTHADGDELVEPLLNIFTAVTADGWTHAPRLEQAASCDTDVSVPLRMTRGQTTDICLTFALPIGQRAVAIEALAVTPSGPRFGAWSIPVTAQNTDQ